jgi:glycosyltransferase involved in cell wall biosynthesis
MLHSLLRDHVRRGGEATVLVPRWCGADSLDGVRVIHDPFQDSGDVAHSLAKRAALLITHLDKTSVTRQLARRTNRPFLQVVHNHLQLAAHGYQRGEPVVFNSRWLARAHGVRGPVVRPPVDAADYRTPERGRGTYVTLINCSHDKGVGVARAIAQRLPRHRFLFVRGAYGFQDPPPGGRNCTVLPHTRAIRDVYARTRVLLMPSFYESWGRTMVEAAAGGIPTIASPMPGLWEASEKGRYAIFRLLSDLDGWASAADCLMSDDDAYDRCAYEAGVLSSRRDPTDDYEAFQRLILRVVRADPKETR